MPNTGAKSGRIEAGSSERSSSSRRSCRRRSSGGDVGPTPQHAHGSTPARKPPSVKNGEPSNTDVGLRPVRRLLERRCGIGRTSQPEERLRQLRRELEERSLEPASILPLLAPVLGIDPEAGYSAVAAEGRKLYQQITDAVHEYLRACTRDAPSLILVEDMHWFDEYSFDVVSSLLGGDLGRHVLVVMTTRARMSLPDGAKVQE